MKPETAGLASARRRLGLSQEVAARAIGVSRRTVQRWESTGVSSSDPKVSARIALMLEIADLAQETYADQIPAFMRSARARLEFRTPREALVEGDLVLVREVLIRSLEGDW